MCGYERSARFHPRCHGLERLQPLVRRKKVQRQQADGSVERTVRGVVDIAFVKPNAFGLRSEQLTRLIQHAARRVDPVETPSRLCFGHRLQFEPASGTEHQNASIGRNKLREQNRDHAVQVAKSRDLTCHALGIPLRVEYI